jgi:hypothetical protein
MELTSRGRIHNSNVIKTGNLKFPAVNACGQVTRVHTPNNNTVYERNIFSYLSLKVCSIYRNVIITFSIYETGNKYLPTLSGSRCNDLYCRVAI